MEIISELCFRCGNDDRLHELMNEIGRNLPSGWSRREEREAYGENSVSTRDLRKFRWDGDDRHPAFELHPLRTVPGSCSIWFVFPLGEGRFAATDRNAALLEFEKIARPIAEGFGIEVELTRAQYDINQGLSEAAAEKLRVFSRSANKGLGGALPVDRERWIDFVLTAYRDGCKLPATMLREWLVEDEGWYFDDADRLAGEYQFGSEILSYSERQSA